MPITVVINIQGQAIPPAFLRTAEMVRQGKNFVVHILVIVSRASLLAKTVLYPSTGELLGLFDGLKKDILLLQNTSFTAK